MMAPLLSFLLFQILLDWYRRRESGCIYVYCYAALCSHFSITSLWFVFSFQSSVYPLEETIHPLFGVTLHIVRHRFWDTIYRSLVNHLSVVTVCRSSCLWGLWPKVCIAARSEGLWHYALEARDISPVAKLKSSYRHTYVPTDGVPPQSELGLIEHEPFMTRVPLKS
jgi:hypothetical protein